MLNRPRLSAQEIQKITTLGFHAFCRTVEQYYPQFQHRDMSKHVHRELEQHLNKAVAEWLQGRTE